MDLRAILEAIRPFVNQWIRPKLYPLTALLTSTAWDGDLRSTTAATLLDLSAVFGVPANVKGINCRITCNDSASASNIGLYFALSPNNYQHFFAARPSGLPNGYYADESGFCPCDANGDVYYSVSASGAGTMEVYLMITGYWL